MTHPVAPITLNIREIKRAGSLPVPVRRHSSAECPMAACVTARTSWMAFKTALAQLLDFTAEKISQVVRDED